MTETLDIRAADIQAGDTLEGWDGYTVVRYQTHPNGHDGRVHLRSLRPTTAPLCWTPKRPDDIVSVTRTASGSDNH